MELLKIGLLVFFGLSIIIILKKGFNEVIKGLESIRDELRKNRNSSQ